jgi:hypothetical protein
VAIGWQDLSQESQRVFFSPGGKLDYTSGMQAVVSHPLFACAEATFAPGRMSFFHFTPKRPHPTKGIPS